MPSSLKLYVLYFILMGKKGNGLNFMLYLSKNPNINGLIFYPYLENST